jgi:hypothetical protein
MSFVYAMLYTSLTAYPLIFQGVYHFNQGVGQYCLPAITVCLTTSGGLPYFGMIIGVFLGGFYILYDQKSYLKKLDANNGVTVPEWRLPASIPAGIAFAGGMSFPQSSGLAFSSFEGSNPCFKSLQMPATCSYLPPTFLLFSHTDFG